MIFGRLICVFGSLAPVPTRVHASVEDITSLQSVRKISLQLYGIRKTTLAVFSISSLFWRREGRSPPVNPPLHGGDLWLEK